MNKIDQAFILCAGFGKRLRPHTDKTPKPLVHVNGRPILDYIIDKLRAHGIKKIVLNAHYKAEQIEDYTKKISGFEHVILSKEEEILETGGGLKKALDEFNNKPFFITSGDSIWEDSAEHTGESALQRLETFWNNENMDITMLLQPLSSMITEGTGDYTLDAGNHATRSHTKDGEAMFTGIRINHPRIFCDSPDHAFSYLGLMDKAEASNRLYGLNHSGNWHHISTPEDLKLTEHYFRETQESG